MAKTTKNETLPDILRDVTSALEDISQQMEWADDEILQGICRYPAEVDALYHSFPLLRSTHTLMATEFVYRSHCRELLERVVNGADTRPGTAAEVCCICCEASLLAPLRSPAAGLYFRMWAIAFPDQPTFGDSGQHHEALEGATMDDLETTARRKLTVKDRKLGDIACTGRHHGEIVQCKYAGT